MKKVNSEPQSGWDAKMFSDSYNLKGNKSNVLFKISPNEKECKYGENEPFLHSYSEFSYLDGSI